MCGLTARVDRPDTGTSHALAVGIQELAAAGNEALSCPSALAGPRREAEDHNMTRSLLTMVSEAAAAVESLVAVTEADHDRATPCAGLDLKALVAHLIGGLRSMADIGEGKPFSFDTDPDLSVEDPKLELRIAADRLGAAFGPPGMAERAFAMPWGETTGNQLLGFELIELVVHGWDIARSLGQDPALDDDLAAAALAGAQQWVDDSARTPQLFGPEVAVDNDAPVLARLVGFLGRDPAWRL